MCVAQKIIFACLHLGCVYLLVIFSPDESNLTISVSADQADGASD